MSFLVLLYTNDTIIICKNTKANMWCLKAVLRVFEITSGLRVNFHINCLVGLNVGEDELNTATHFLYCRIGVVPFNYLGILVEENPRMSTTWRPVIKNLIDRLSTLSSR